MKLSSKTERVLAGSAMALVAGLSWGATAHAQAPAPAAAEAASPEIVVTGSRIRGVAPVGSALIAVNREDIEASNAVTVTQLIQELPQVFNLGVSESSRGQGGNSNITYSSGVNIRGIGPFATLVIIDGHRVVPQGTSGFAVDPSILPTLGIQRIDVVADGASAVYGSDAVAGVVNLILRRNLDGIEASARYGVGDEYDEHQYGVAMGQTFDRGQITIAFENGYHSALNGNDRDFFRADLTPFGGNDFRTTLCAPGNIVVGGVSYAIPAGGVTNANRNLLVPNTANKCDQFKLADLLPEQNHNTLSFTADFNPTDAIKVYTEGFAATREFSLLSGEVRANTFTVPSTNPNFVLPPGVAATSESVQYAPINDYPQSFQDGFSNAFNILVGTEVDLGHNWKFGGSYTYGMNQDEQVNHLIAPPAATLTAALNSTNPATAFNPFGVSDNADIANALLISNSNAKGHTVFQGFEAQLDGPVMTLPGGEVRVAMGYEGQKNHFQNMQILGTFAAPTGAVREFARDVDSFYGELLIPIAGGEFSGPGMRGLELNLASRYDKYTDVGDTTNPKVGINWIPVEGLKVHGSWGTSFRAPGIAQIYGNSNNLFLQNVPDPTCGGCIRQSVYRSGGNLALRPETAETYSVGFDLAPTWSANFRLSASYFNVEYENQVNAFLGDLTVLQKESQFAGTQIIIRNPTQAFINQQVAETGATILIPSPLLVFVDGRGQNLGISQSEGIDFQASYRLDTESLGNFVFNLNGTRFLKYESAVTPAAASLDKLNTIFSPLEFKARYGVRWSAGAWQANLNANYINGYTNDLSTPIQEVDASTTVDGQLNFTFARDSEGLHDVVLGLGMQNMFDEEPAFVNIAQSANGGGGFDPTLVSPVGRVISVSLAAKF